MGSLGRGGEVSPDFHPSPRCAGDAGECVSLS